MLRASKQKGDQAGECGLHKYLFDGLTSFIAYEERCALVKIMWCLAAHHTCGEQSFSDDQPSSQDCVVTNSLKSHSLVK